MTDDVTRANYNRIIEIMSRLDQLRFLHDEEAWYIDAELQMPYVEALLTYLQHYDPFYTAVSATKVNSNGNDSISGSNHAHVDAFTRTHRDHVAADEVNSSMLAELNNSSSASYESDDEELEYEKVDSNHNDHEAEVSDDDDQLSERSNDLNSSGREDEPTGLKLAETGDDEVVDVQEDKTKHVVPDFLLLRRSSHGKGSRHRHNETTDQTAAAEDREDMRRRQQKLIRERRLRKREYMNFEFYRTYLKSLIPSVCSICFRSSSYTIDLLTSQTIERLIFSMTQKLADKDSQIKARMVGSDNGMNPTSLFGINFMKRSYAGILVASLQEMRDKQSPQLQSLNAAMGAASILTDRKVHLDVPGLELVMIKKMKPVQDLFVRLFAVEMKIPLAEKTLFELLALMLQSNSPHYR